MSNRIYKVNELIKNEVSSILLRELNYTKGFVTISAVETTPDLRYATIWYLVAGGSEQEVADLLEEKERDIQKILNSRLSMKHVPKISFALDHSGEYASKINKLIEKTHEDEDSRSDSK